MSAQPTSWVQLGTLANRPAATARGMEEGYFYFATDTQQLYVIRVSGIGGPREWVPAGVASLPSGVIHINQAPALTVNLTVLPGVGKLFNLISLRVTGGAAAAGPRLLTDPGTPATAALAQLSLDGSTLTFEANVTDILVQYTPTNV